MDALNLNFMQFANQVPYLNEQFVLGCFDFMRRKTSSVAASVAPKSTKNQGATLELRRWMAALVSKTAIIWSKTALQTSEKVTESWFRAFCPEQAPNCFVVNCLIIIEFVLSLASFWSKGLRAYLLYFLTYNVSKALFARICQSAFSSRGLSLPSVPDFQSPPALSLGSTLSDCVGNCDWSTAVDLYIKDHIYSLFSWIATIHQRCLRFILHQILKSKFLLHYPLEVLCQTLLEIATEALRWIFILRTIFCDWLCYFCHWICFGVIIQVTYLLSLSL